MTEIECLACVEAIKHWRPYLWGREFTLQTDHAALRWLHTMKDTVEGGSSSRLVALSSRAPSYSTLTPRLPPRELVVDDVLHRRPDEAPAEHRLHSLRR